MSVYAVDKLMSEARRLATEYRRVTGKTLPVSGEIAVNDAVRLLNLEPVSDQALGYDATLTRDGTPERFQIKARVVFDEAKGAHRLGELKLDKPWDTLLLVLMNSEYETVEIYAVPRALVIATLAGRASQKKGTLTVPRIKIIGTRVWSRDPTLAPAASAV
jgi:hypothetical protein